MRGQNWQPDEITSAILMNGLIKNDPNENPAEHIRRLGVDYGLSPSIGSLTTIIQTLSRKGDMKGAVEWYQIILDEYPHFVPDLHIFTPIIRGYLRADSYSEAMKYLNFLPQFNLKPDQYLCNCFIEYHRLKGELKEEQEWQQRSKFPPTKKKPKNG